MSGSKGQEIVYTWARLNTPTHKELSDTIDAALRVAKVEGFTMAVKELGALPVSSGVEAYQKLLARIAELECAAQIEEGE